MLELRWDLVEGSGGGIPTPLLVMLVAWLMLIFASFGSRPEKSGRRVDLRAIGPADFGVAVSDDGYGSSVYRADAHLTGPLQRVVDFMKS